MAQGKKDPAIIETAEQRTALREEGQAQQDAADNRERLLLEKRQRNAAEQASESNGETERKEPDPEPPIEVLVVEPAPPESPQTAPEPAQPPQEPLPVSYPDPTPTMRPGQALGLDAPAKTITAVGVVEATVKTEVLSTVVRKFACAKQPNGEFLVRAGQVVQVVDPSSPAGVKAFRRDGDKKIRFIGGISEETRDLEVIAFCEAHSDIYDVNDPGTPLRFDLESIQLPTATREPIALPGIDIEKAIRGEIVEGGLTGDSPIGAARKQVQEANERL